LIGVATHVHPLVFGHAEAPRGRHRHHQCGGTLIHLIPGHHQAGIRIADHPILIGDRYQLVHRPFHR
jgi:hypothetical protein